MARTLVQALDGLNFPCDRASIVEYASRNDIAPRAMTFLEQLPEQQYASMGELFAALPTKASQRKTRPRLKVVDSPAKPRQEPPPTDDVLDEEPEAQAPETEGDGQHDDANIAAEVDAEDQGRDEEQQEAEQNAQPVEPASAGPANQSPAPRQPNRPNAAARIDPFGVAGQWQRLWLRSAENYTRLFMPWLRR